MRCYGENSNIKKLERSVRHCLYHEITFEAVLIPETNSSHLKMDGWKMSFLLGRPIFRDYVSFREGKQIGFFELPRSLEPILSYHPYRCQTPLSKKTKLIW